MSQFMCQSPGQMGILIKGVRLFFIYIFIYLFLDYCSSMSFIYQCLVRKNDLFRDKKFNRCFALCSQYHVQIFPIQAFLYFVGKPCLYLPCSCYGYNTWKWLLIRSYCFSEWTSYSVNVHFSLSRFLGNCN